MGAGGLAVRFNGIPDVPITHLVVAFFGGPSALLVAGPNLCSHPGALVGDFVAQSGATAHDTAPLTVVGNCSSGGGGRGTGRGGSGGSTAKSPTAKRPTARLSFSGLSGRSARLTLMVAAGRNEPDLKLVKIRLPSGLSLHDPKLTRGVVVRLDGHARAKTVRLVKGTLTVSLGGDGRVAVITLTRPCPCRRQISRHKDSRAQGLPHQPDRHDHRRERKEDDVAPIRSGALNDDGGRLYSTRNRAPTGVVSCRKRSCFESATTSCTIILPRLIVMMRSCSSRHGQRAGEMHGGAPRPCG